jgi:hypothetical protein
MSRTKIYMATSPTSLNEIAVYPNNVLCCVCNQRVSKSSTGKVIFVLSSFKRRLVYVKSPWNCVAYTQETGFTATQTQKAKGI